MRSLTVLFVSALTRLRNTSLTHWSFKTGTVYTTWMETRTRGVLPHQRCGIASRHAAYTCSGLTSRPCAIAGIWMVRSSSPLVTVYERSALTCNWDPVGALPVLSVPSELQHAIGSVISQLIFTRIFLGIGVQCFRRRFRVPELPEPCHPIPRSDTAPGASPFQPPTCCGHVQAVPLRPGGCGETLWACGVRGLGVRALTAQVPGVIMRDCTGWGR